MRYLQVSVNKIAPWLVALVILYVLAIIVALFLSRDLIPVAALSVPKVFGTFLLLVLLSFGLRIFKWCLLLRAVNPSVSVSDAARLYVGGIPMAITPGRVGELWRAWILSSKFQTFYRRGIPLVICDRFLDLNILLLFATIGVFRSSEFLQLTFLALLVFLPPMLLFFKPNWCVRLTKIVWTIAGKRLPKKFAALLTVFKNIGLLSRPSLYFALLPVTFLAWGTEAFAISLAAKGLGGELSLFTAMSSLGLANIVGVLTFLPGGIGGQEATMIYLLQKNGNSLATAIAVAGTEQICSLFIPALVGLPFCVQLSRRRPVSAS